MLVSETVFIWVCMHIRAAYIYLYAYGGITYLYVRVDMGSVYVCMYMDVNV